MDIRLILAIVFFAILGIFLINKRKKLTTQGYFPFFYFSMYKTKLGLNGMNFLAKKFPKTFKVLSNIGIVVGFIGMALISYELIKNLIKLFYQPEVVAQSVGLVLPFQVKGGFYVPFEYWILSIFILAVVHEFSHGIIARLHNIKIKSSGFAFLGILVPVLPAAFVEPDESKLNKAKTKKQLAVFAAGPFSNIVLGFMVLAFLIFAMGPIANQVVINDGVKVTGFIDGNYPASTSGLKPGEIILAIDDVNTLDANNFSNYLSTRFAGDMVKLKTNESYYTITLGEHPEDSTKGYLGVTISQNTKMNPDFIEKYGKFSANVILWFAGLLFWLYLLNLGIGLFNLVPLGPVDGGRMLKVVLLKYFEEKKALAIWSRVSMFFLIVILVNILAGFFF